MPVIYPQIKPLLMYATLGTILAYLNYHVYIYDIGAMVTPWCYMNTLVLWEHHSALL